MISIGAHVNVADAIRKFVGQLMPSARCNFVYTDATTQMAWMLCMHKNSDPWEEMVDFAYQHGLYLGYNATSNEVTLTEELIVPEGAVDDLIRQIFDQG